MSYVKQCRQCGKDFQKNQYTSLKTWNTVTQFCSRACKGIASRDRIIIICKQCSGTIELPRCKRENIFCSIPCRDSYWKSHPEESATFKNGHEGYRGEKNKPWLGKEFSEEHKKNISMGIRAAPDFAKSMKARGMKMRGSNHWNWKGGISGEEKRIRQTPEYRSWRLAVYRRDHFTCQDCGKKPKQIVAHHVKPFDEFPSLRFDVSNGVTLCRACHRYRHWMRDLEGQTPFQDRPIVEIPNMKKEPSIRIPKTHCPHGHAYTEDNLVKNRLPYKVCLLCARQRAKEATARYRLKKKALVINDPSIGVTVTA